MKNLIIIGGGGHAISCLEIINSLKKFKIIGIVDKNKPKLIKNNKYKFFNSKDENSELINKAKYFFIAIGNYKKIKLRNQLFNYYLKKGLKPAKIISKNAIVSKDAIISDGSIIMNSCIINAGTFIGKNCIINTSSIIEHETKILDNSIISTSVTINGQCSIGKSCFIGSGSVMSNNIEIKNNSFYKIGSIIK
tara:strand:- start:1397 stop:1975 length:579 start_codon:yes stop_codon:yes gene_type:complete